MAQSDAVEFTQDELSLLIGAEPLRDDGVGHVALDVLVHAQFQRPEQVGLADQNEVVVLGEILDLGGSVVADRAEN